jgi:hypothetical protein
MVKRAGIRGQNLILQQNYLSGVSFWSEMVPVSATAGRPAWSLMIPLDLLIANL